jgi:hypothetical protein
MNDSIFYEEGRYSVLTLNNVAGNIELTSRLESTSFQASFLFLIILVSSSRPPKPPNRL